MLNDSILDSIKKLIGITPDDNTFDEDIIIHINTVFMSLNQMGVGPSKPFTISDSSSTWSDFILDNNYIEAIKTYIYLRVRIIFDPPQNSVVLNSIENMIKEYEWRLSIHNSFSGGES